MKHKKGEQPKLPSFFHVFSVFCKYSDLHSNYFLLFFGAALVLPFFMGGTGVA